MNLFATILTYPAPTANYRGESELNRAVIQKITDGRFEYPIISPEAMRNALREILRKYGLPMNRERLPDEEQLAVKFSAYPNPDEFADDFLFGYLVAQTGDDRRKTKQAIIEDKDDLRGMNLRPELQEQMEKLNNVSHEKKEEDLKKEEKKINDEIKKIVDRFTGFRFKRDSILRMNLAKGLEPYRHDAVFTQSPLASENSAYRNATSSALLHRETAATAFQYPFALNGEDCKSHPDWAKALLKAVGELNDVAGNHARSYYEMAPASIAIRLTDQLVAGYETYHFKLDGRGPNNERRLTSSLIDDLLDEELDLPGAEFYLGGEIVREMTAEVRGKLTAEKKGVTLDADPRRLLTKVADVFLSGGQQANQGAS